MSKINIRSFSNENEDGAPDLVGITTFSATSFFVPTRGTTAQRPSDHVEEGSLRYNYDTKNLEYYRGDKIGWSQFELIDPDLGGGTGSNTGLGTRGMIGGCQTPGNNPATELRFITISTFGADQDFGDLSASRQFSIGLASRTRGISLGGRSSNSPFPNTNVIEFVTFASTGDATDFGDSSLAQRGAGASSQTRGVYTLGNISPYANISYITLASTGDSDDFGDLSNTHRNIDGCGHSSSTRGIFAGSYTPTPTLGRDEINFVTLSTLGNTTDFGQMSYTVGQRASSSNSTRGIFAGAYVTNNSNIIEFITIATTGNTTDFGDLTDARRRAMSVSSPTRAVILGGGTPGNVGDRTTMESIEFATTGDAVEFGTLSVNYEAGSNFSNGHGGL